MTAKKSYFKKILIGLFVVILICIGGFYIYASDYYHAKDYEVSNIKVEQQDNYTVYGDTNSKTGLIFYPGGKVEANHEKRRIEKSDPDCQRSTQGGYGH